MIAFVSDLHSNLEALDAALRDIELQGVTAIVCLGDVVGYGASPREVALKTRRACPVTLLGNHDAALLDERDAVGFNERALQAIDFTRQRLDPEVEENGTIWDWLGGLVPSMELQPGNGAEAVQIVHASPRSPLTEYLMPNAARQPERMEANFAAALRRLTFFGHTHHPGWFAEGGGFCKADGHEARLTLENDRRYLINVGSVGQPRDGDPRLAYALFDGAAVRWRRIEYDVAAASRRIEQAEGLPASLGARLLVGR